MVDWKRLARYWKDHRALMLFDLELSLQDRYKMRRVKEADRGVSEASEKNRRYQERLLRGEIPRPDVRKGRPAPNVVTHRGWETPSERAISLMRDLEARTGAGASKATTSGGVSRRIQSLKRLEAAQKANLRVRRDKAAPKWAHRARANNAKGMRPG